MHARSRAALLALTAAMPLTVAGVFVAQRSAATEQPGAPDGQRHLQSGTEIAAVLVAGSFCVSSRDPTLKQTIAAVRQQMEAEGRDRAFTPVTIGVALDWDPAVGERFLRGIGSFDELVTGRNWLNTAAVHLIWRDDPGSTGLPQLVILSHDIRVGSDRITVGPDQVLARLVGVRAMNDWLEAERARPTLSGGPGEP